MLISGGPQLLFVTGSYNEYKIVKKEFSESFKKYTPLRYISPFRNCLWQLSTYSSGKSPRVFNQKSRFASFGLILSCLSQYIWMLTVSFWILIFLCLVMFIKCEQNAISYLKVARTGQVEPTWKRSWLMRESQIVRLMGRLALKNGKFRGWKVELLCTLWFRVIVSLSGVPCLWASHIMSLGWKWRGWNWCALEPFPIQASVRTELFGRSYLHFLVFSFLETF